MNTRRIIAALTTISLGVTALPALTTPADAAINQRSYTINVARDGNGGFTNVDVNKGRVSWLYFNHPTATTRLLQSALYIDGYVNGAPIAYVGSSAEVLEATTVGGKDRVTLRHFDPNSGVEMLRTFTIDTNRVEVEVTLNNTTGSAADLRLELTNGIIDRDFIVTAEQNGTAYNVKVGDAYNLAVGFEGASKIGKGPERADAVAGGTHRDAHHVAGIWETTATPNRSLTARLTIDGAVDRGSTDSDGDGFPDEWETRGFTDQHGNEFPLHRWGADPNKVDLYLQLNWMKSEWETLKCSETRKYAPTEADFRQFIECAEANTNVYRPSRQSLNELVDIYAQEGINLHIDAGEYYTNIPGLKNLQGGATEDFTRYYFGGNTTAGLKLLQERDRLLNGRQSVFRVGIIGDQQTPQNLSSGNALIRDGAFYVSKNYLMTSQTQLRNTIMHEFGHNLGLTHSGAYDVRKPTSDYVPNYRSVMNYLYQFSDFRYTNEISTSKNKQPLPEACKTVNCYKGEYEIAPDWPNLEFSNGQIAAATGTAGTTNPDDDSHSDGHDHDHTAGEGHPSVRQLEIYAAEYNNGKAGFRVRNEAGAENVIIANRTDSKLHVELTNLGIDIHNFTLQATYPGGRYEHTYPVEGALSDYNRLPVEVPISNTAGYTDSTMPITFRVLNENNELVAEERIDVSVLNYTGDDVKKLMEELRRNNSPLLDFAERSVGNPDGAAGVTQPSTIATQPNAPIAPTPPSSAPVTSTNAAPSVTVNPTPTQQPGAGIAPKPQVSDQLSPGAIAGIIAGVLTLIGLLGAAAGFLGGAL